VKAVADRLAVRDRVAEVFYGDETCNDPDCENCEATLDALTDRVVLLMTEPV
jgi:hypothetical protein